MYGSSTRRSPGNYVAEAVAGAWRVAPESLRLSLKELREIAPLLLRTGTAALTWRRIESSFDRPLTGSLLDLRAAHREALITAAVHEINIQDIFKRVQAAGIEAVVFKGWALARLYPDAGLRSYGDIDLWVHPEKLEKLYSALPSGTEYAYCVEPHVSFYPQYERSFDEIMTASQLIRVNDVQVRVPCHEDHLRFICLHFLYHGGWRPLWLCDVATMVESASSEFDWDRCLSGKRKHADWIACVIGLAHQLLGAEVTGTAVEKRAKNLPGWLAPAVLKQWGQGTGMSFAENLSFSLPRRLFKPGALMRAMREHWRNPIQASVEMNAWFNETPRPFLQFGSAFLRIPEFARFFGQEIRRT